MKILGIDPGYERLGIAVLEKNAGDRKERLLFSTCFKTKATLPFPERLLLLGAEVERVISEFAPDKLAIEKLYFERNTTSAMAVSEARGVVLYAAKKAGLTIHEFTPQEIKSAVTGYGKAAKDAVHTMVSRLIALPSEVKQDDEIDAIAAALTGFATSRER